MMDDTNTPVSGLDDTPAAPTPAQAERTMDNSAETHEFDGHDDDLVEGESHAPVEDLEEFEEFDWEGKKVKGPKGLKDGLLRQSDYTRKTQEVAAKAKELEEMRERISQQARVSEEELTARARAQQINSELEKFKNWGWNEYQQLNQTDPVKADELWRYKQHLVSEKAGLDQTLSAAEQRRTLEAQQNLAKRLEQTREHARKLPGYKEGETDRQVIEFAKSKGFSEAELRAAMSPKVFEMFHLARLGANALNKPAAKPAAPTPEPLVTVSAKGNPPARKSLSQMSMEEYAAYRSKQLNR